MQKFMDQNFMLHSAVAKQLFFDAAKDMPIFDYHCHLVPGLIARDYRFPTITEAWLGGDHYKWRLMRTCGFDEKLVTGDADPFDKFMAWAETVENAIGNPIYHWTMLELQRYFGISEPLGRKTAKAIYKAANAQLAQDPSLSVFGIMKKMNVYAVGTTDDPADDLHFHELIRKAGQCPAKVLPSFRPDKACQLEKPAFPAYLEKLGAAAGMKIRTVDDVVEALVRRLDFFVSKGCRAADHGLVLPPAVFKSAAACTAILGKRLAGKDLSFDEGEAYRTYVATALARAYAKRGVVMQLHLNAIRDLNAAMFAKLGPDTGYDAAHDFLVAERLAAFMKNLSVTDEVPKTILYSLNPKDYYSLATAMGCFQGGGIRGKIQLGPAWWFCDHRDGMEEQLRTLANLSLLPCFVGMLTDSRSFLSYPRHEYFRRILCNLIGGWVEAGEYPADRTPLKKIVSDISFNNAKAYFNA